MPIAETPLEHVEVELATKCTGEETVEPLPGVETPTQAEAQVEQNKAMRHTSRYGALTLISLLSSFY
jgi:hypothetical protein